MVDRIDQRFDAVERRFDQVDARMDRLEARMDRIEAELVSIRRDMFNGMVALVVAQLGTLASIIVAAVLVG